MATSRNGKRSLWFLLAAGLVTSAVSVRADHVSGVIGLVNLTNYQAALLAITDSPPDASFLMATHKWVTEGQEFDDLYLKAKRLHVVINQIDFTNGAVRVKENNAEMLYVPTATNLAAAAIGKNILLNQADFDDALDLYAVIKGRTVLVHPEVKQSPLTITATASNNLEAIAVLEKALRGSGTVIVADGAKFEWIVPAGNTNVISPAAIPARLPPKPSSPTNTVDTLSEGSINFINVPLPQVLDVYQALTSRKWVETNSVPAAITLSFHNQTPLTKTETLHAFDVLFAWHGLKAVDLDDKSFKLVPLAVDQ